MFRKIVAGALGLCLVAGLAAAESTPLAVVELDGKKGCVDTTGKEVIPLIYSDIDLTDYKSSSLIAVKDGGKIGIYNHAGRRVLVADLDKITAFNEGIFAGKKEGKWSFYDATGKVLASGFADVGVFGDGLAPAKTDKYWGYVDKSGREAIPFIYKKVRNFSEGLAAVQAGKKWGYIDTQGNEILAPLYKQARDFHQGLALVDKRYWIDTTGRQVALSRKYSYVGNFQPNGLAEVGQYHRRASFLDYVSIGWGWGRGGGWYDDWYGPGWGGFFYMNPSFAVPEDLQRGYIDMRGMEVISTENEYVGEFVGDYAVVGNGNRWGMVNTQGQTVIPFMYERLTPLSNGLAAFRFDGKWGYVDDTNNMVIGNKFDSVTPFFGEYATAVMNGQGGIIDRAGKFIMPSSSEYKSLGALRYQRAAVRINGKWGYVDETGRLVIPAQYDKASMFR